MEPDLVDGRITKFKNNPKDNDVSLLNNNKYNIIINHNKCKNSLNTFIRNI